MKAILTLFDSCNRKRRGFLSAASSCFVFLREKEKMHVRVKNVTLNTQTRSVFVNQPPTMNEGVKKRGRSQCVSACVHVRLDPPPI